MTGDFKILNTPLLCVDCKYPLPKDDFVNGRCGHCHKEHLVWLRKQPVKIDPFNTPKETVIMTTDSSENNTLPCMSCGTNGLPISFSGSITGCYICKDCQAPDMVNSPPHYTAGGLEPIEIMEAKFSEEEIRGYCLGNAVKYILRAKHKGNMTQDLKKANWYLERYLKLLEEQ